MLLTWFHQFNIILYFYCSGSVPPAVVWAQRKDKIFLTINLEDCKSPDIKLTETTLTFK